MCKMSEDNCPKNNRKSVSHYYCSPTVGSFKRIHKGRLCKYGAAFIKRWGFRITNLDSEVITCEDCKKRYLRYLTEAL